MAVGDSRREESPLPGNDSVRMMRKGMRTPSSAGDFQPLSERSRAAVSDAKFRKKQTIKFSNVSDDKQIVVAGVVGLSQKHQTFTG